MCSKTCTGTFKIVAILEASVKYHFPRHESSVSGAFRVSATQTIWLLTNFCPDWIRPPKFGPFLSAHLAHTCAGNFQKFVRTGLWPVRVFVKFLSAQGSVIEQDFHRSYYNIAQSTSEAGTHLDHALGNYGVILRQWSLMWIGFEAPVKPSFSSSVSTYNHFRSWHAQSHPSHKRHTTSPLPLSQTPRSSQALSSLLRRSRKMHRTRRPLWFWLGRISSCVAYRFFFVVAVEKLLTWDKLIDRRSGRVHYALQCSHPGVHRVLWRVQT